MEQSTNEHQYRIAPNEYLANERTFLAWIRTSIALMGFGFVVVKFSLFLRQLTFVLTNKLIIQGKGYSPFIGISLVVIGAVMALLAYIRFRSIQRQLKNGSYFPSFLLSFLLTVSIIIISIVLIYFLLPNL